MVSGSSWPRRAPVAGADSAGFRSKFGLTFTEALDAFEYLKQRGMADCLQLVHFHLGSQITNIRSIKNALTEAARVYVELHRVGAGVKFLDVGGGLGVDYDGSQTDFESSVNYTLQEYANDVVFRIKSVCEECGVPHPTIISESGRAVVAYHSMLVFDVLGVSNFDSYEVPAEIPPDAPQQVSDLFGIHRDLSKKNLLEGYHDAHQAMEEALNLFNLGGLTIELRALTERLFWAVCNKILKMVRGLDFIPEELEGLAALLSDTYFCNFSVFQSMPDSWAVHQLFPVMPIHRLDEAPRAGRFWGTSPATRTARSTSSSTCATFAPRWNYIPLPPVSLTTSALSCWGRTKKFSAISTTSSATLMPCM